MHAEFGDSSKEDIDGYRTRELTKKHTRMHSYLSIPKSYGSIIEENELNSINSDVRRSSDFMNEEEKPELIEKPDLQAYNTTNDVLPQHEPKPRFSEILPNRDHIAESFT